MLHLLFLKKKIQLSSNSKFLPYCHSFTQTKIQCWYLNEKQLKGNFHGVLLFLFTSMVFSSIRRKASKESVFFHKLQSPMLLSIQPMMQMILYFLLENSQEAAVMELCLLFFLITLFSFLQVGSESGSWLSNRVQISHLYDSRSAHWRMWLL